jgi:threonine/homoserine/homoserine lactone efflux protein
MEVGLTMGIHDLWLFIVAGLLLNITPGPDMALIQGTRAGMAAALGIGVGLFVHITTAAIGISAIVVASALAFTILKWLGALYLIYLCWDSDGLDLVPIRHATGTAAGLGSKRSSTDIRSGFSHQRSKPDGCNVLSGVLASVHLRRHAFESRCICHARPLVRRNRHGLESRRRLVHRQTWSLERLWSPQGVA